MFKCDLCHISIGPRISPIVKVTEIRKVEYDGGYDEDGIENPPTEGFEIVKEIRICKGCE